MSLKSINLLILESTLQRCTNPRQIQQIHAQMVVTGFIHDTFAASRLFSFCSASIHFDLDYSRRLLMQIPCPNPFIWNTFLRYCVRRGCPQLCLPLYRSMLRRESFPDNFTHPIVIQAAGIRSKLWEGMQIHAHAWRFGFGSDVYVVNNLISMYAVCEHLADARNVFNESPVLDSVSWNSILAAYVQVGDINEAVWVFGQMPERNVIAANSMIVLFGKCNRVRDARKVFDEMVDKDVVSWSALISCYEQNKFFNEALDVFIVMNRVGIPLDEIVLVSALSACANLAAMKLGESIHGLVVRNGLQLYVNLRNALLHMYSSCRDIVAARQLFETGSCLDIVSWNSMIAGYLKSGDIEEARVFFDEMPQKDVVSWTTMVAGYCQHDRFSETLELFYQMQNEAILPDETILASVISACARLLALEQGKWVHAYIRKNGFAINVFLGTALVDMYMKCGCVETALEVFDKMAVKETSSWNVAILGLAMNGHVRESLEKFSEMEKCGVMPNEITFIGVLGACRHGGLVDEGRQHFNSMLQSYNILPNVKHYGCMVDLLGRSGLLNEAEELVGTMPMTPDVATWGALLGACKKHNAADIGERIGKKLLELEPQHDGFHVLLSNMYASKGMWGDMMELRGMMKQRGVTKVPGCSMIESNGTIHEFLAGVTTHPQAKEIEKMLNEMARRMKLEGYQPDTVDVVYDIEEEEKESTLYRHSEKLAIAFGLISILPSVPIRIMKNLRICGDCHVAAKAISKAFDREIIIRDRQRFHHFRGGLCSCAEYW